MQTYDFEPMSIGRILDTTFRIYRDNFIRFITIVAIIQIPLGLFSIVSLSLVRSSVPVIQKNSSQQVTFNNLQNRGNSSTLAVQGSSQNTQTVKINPTTALIGGIAVIISSILSLLGQLLCRGALTKSVSEVYLGNELSVNQAYKFVLPKFLTLILASIMVGLVTAMGFVLLIVPGVIFSLWFAFTTPAIVIENLKATEGMTRSKNLASGNLGKIFSVSFLVLLIAIVISMVINGPVSIVGRIALAANPVLHTVVTQSVSLAAQIIMIPIGSIAFILLYYDLRIRKEGFDLEMLANNIGSEQGGINVDQPNQPDNSEI